MRRIGLLLLVAAGTASAGVDEQSNLAVGEVGKRIEGWLKDADKAGYFGAVLAAKDGEVIAALGVGASDLSGKRKNTPATLFEIASATKQFTASAVLVLVQEGKLALDDPISRHLPGIPEDCSKITVRHLLQHTSGIPGSNARGGGTRLEAVIPSFLAGGPRHEPGTHFEYWNQGYSLLSEIIARVSGQPYTTFCRQKLFAVAGMDATCFTGDAPPKGAQVAVGGSSRGRPRGALEHPYGEYGFQYRGMGGAVTNVWDLWRWDRALRTDKPLQAASRKLLFEPGLKDYALGWYVRNKAGGRMVQFHGGGVRGFTCLVRRYPAENGCLFVLANRDDAPLRRIADGVESLLFGGEAKPLVALPESLPDDVAEALVGSYVSDRGNVLEIRRMGGVLRFWLKWYPPKGPVTRGFVGRAGKSPTTALFNDGSKAYEVELKRKGSKPVEALNWGGTWYRRRAG